MSEYSIVASQEKRTFDMVSEDEALIPIPLRLNLRHLWESTLYNCNRFSSPWVHCCEEADYGPNAVAELWIEDPDWDDSMYDGDLPGMVWTWHDLPEDYKNQSVLKKWVTIEDLVEAYTKIIADNKYHCGEPVDKDPQQWDSCCTDYMIQYTFFGKLIYG